MNDQPLWVRALLARDLSPAEYRVWVYLAWRQGGNGHAWPSQALIARDLGLTVRAVRNLTKRLQSKGWLAIELPDTPGRGRPCKYIIRCPKRRNSGSSIQDEKGGTEIPLLDEEKGNGDAQKGGTGVPSNTIQGTHLESSSVKSNIVFDQESGRFVGVTDSRRRDWAEAYPDVDVGVEIRRAEAWYDANPTRRKKNHARFLANWLGRAERDANVKRTQRQYQRPQRRASFREQISSVGERVEV